MVVATTPVSYRDAMVTPPPQSTTSPPGALDVHAFCENMLQGVSRTFALSIPELPRPLDEWVRCAYLVCRMIDTLEDRPGRDERDRQYLFDRFLEALGPPVNAQALQSCAAAFADHDVNDPCTLLMTNADIVLNVVSSFPPGAIEAIRRCAVDMTAGLRRTPLPPRTESPRCLFDTMHQLERYCHYAAGVVGVMLTRLFAVYLGRDAVLESTELTREPRASARTEHRMPKSPDRLFIDRKTLHRGKRFGRGLQLTNIIKDHPADLADGRCFIPARVAWRCGYDPAHLLQPALPLPVRVAMARRATAHLDVALEYSLDLPRQPVGIRLFCVQPMMMALMTLQRVITHPDPTPDDRPKITRAQVTEVMFSSRRVSRDDCALRAWYADLREKLETALRDG